MKTNTTFLTLFKLLAFSLLSGSLYAQEAVHGLDGGAGSSSAVPPGRTQRQSIGNVGSPNLFNGSHNVYIPIYSFENSYGNYGVGMSYNTKGVKVDEMATEVGLHWNLAAGGSITRQIKDIPDDLLITHISPVFVNGFELRDYAGKMAYNMNPSQRPYTAAVKDMEHDDFMVSAAGLSFTFNIGIDGFVFTHPHKHVKIEILNGDAVIALNGFNVSPPNLGFRITDDQGIVYIFKPHTFTDWEEPRFFHPAHLETFNEVFHNIAIGWEIDKIIFPDGSEIVYHYGYKRAVNGIGNMYTFHGSSSTPAAIQSVGGEKRFLERIEYPNNEVVRFAYIDNSCTYTNYILDSIIVTAANKSLKYSLEHNIEAALGYTQKFDKRDACQTLSVIPTGFTQKDYYRLFLREINVHGMTGSLSDNLYSFKYHSTKLPPYKSGKQDFFGYFNGNTGTIGDNGRNLMPTHGKVGGGSYTGTARHYSGTHAQAGLLTEVHNGYGGVTKYTYEAHSGLTVYMPFSGLVLTNHSNQLIDGVRLKSIETIDERSPDMRTITEYTYEGGQQFTPRGSTYTVNRFNPAGTAVTEYRYFSHITSPLLLVNNSNVGYSKVTTITRNIDNAQLSRTISYFTNLNDHLSSHTAKYLRVGSSAHYYALPYINRQYLKDWEIGLEYKTETFDHNDNIMGMQEHFFTFVLDTTSTIGKVENIKTASAQANGVDSLAYYRKYTFDSYRPYSGNVLLSKTVSRKYYSNTAYVTDEVKYTYNNRNKIHSIETENSEGRRFITYNIYNTDIKIPVPALEFDYPLALQVAQEKWVRDDVEDPSSIYLLESAVFFHDKSGTHIKPSRKGYISRFENQIKDISFTGYAYTNVANFTANRYNYIKNIYGTGAAPSGFKLLIDNKEYDTRNRPLETSAMNGVRTDAVIYDNVSGEVLASAVNTPYNQIGFTGFDEAVKTGSGKIYTHEDIFITGNFQYQGHGIDGGTVFGNDYICGQSYRLNTVLLPGAAQPVLIYQNTLQSGKKYVLSFWSKGGTPTLQGTGSALGTYSFQTKYTVGSWKYYVVFLTPTGNTGLTIRDNGTSGVIIDEVRLHPLTSQMTAKTYSPIVGVTAEADTDGRITYYEYDDLGRLMLVRDQNGYILKKYERNKL